MGIHVRKREFDVLRRHTNFSICILSDPIEGYELV